MPTPVIDERERRTIIAEIVVVIALGVLPHVISVVYGWTLPDAAHPPRNVVYFAYAAMRNLQIVLPLLWIMFRSGRGWSFYGMVRLKPLIDLPTALLAVIVFGLSSWTMRSVLHAVAQVVPLNLDTFAAIGRNDATLHVMHEPMRGAGVWTAFVLYQISNGFGEEMILRGYLINRIRDLTGRPATSVLLVAALAASYHVYQGAYAATIIFGGQAAIGWVYLKVPRTVPFAIGHGLYDIFLYVSRAMATPAG